MMRMRWARTWVGIGTAVLAASVWVAAQEVVRFPDKGLEAAIRGAVFVSSGALHDYDVSWLSVLDASRRGIGDLTGIGVCTSLRDIDL